ncbi:hypothetical protein BJY52DRAFT_1224767 [Lactarius psammicola]|nr:hypothetical protein BJY52DRAFT_1224767 [Lactarius psammicola]
MSKPEYNTDAMHYQPQTSEPDGFTDIQSPKSAYPSISMNQPCPVKGMYPLLDLITEQGSSGLVDKIIIAQESLQEFINALSPGAYSSITKVNFKILDNVVLKPFGIYGSKEEIVRFLREINAVDDNTDSAQKLLTRENGHTTGSSEPVLISGLYIVRSFLSTSNEQAYVVYWPEDTTWDDRAASPVQRNRVTFMREHSRALVWGSDDNDKADEGGGDDDDDDDSTSTDSDSDRVFCYEVAKTLDQEEKVAVRAGFVVPVRYKMNSPLLVNQAPPPDSGIDPGAVCPTLLHGEKVQGFMTATFMPATRAEIMGPVGFSHDHQTADQIRLRFGDGVVLVLPENLEVMSKRALISTLGLHTRFPTEHEAWESSETEIKHRFQEVTSLRKAEVHAKTEQDFAGIRVQVQRAVVNELLKTFPSLRGEGFLPESSSAEPTDPKGDYNSAENSLRDLFLLYPQTKQVFWGNTRGSDFGSCLKAPEFQFKKRRMMFLRLLNSDSQDGKGLSVDLARSVADAVLGQQDERSTLAILETFGKDDKGIFSRLPNPFRSSRGKELWESASRRALSVSDSQFLSELKTTPVSHYLYEAASDVEETAYAFLTKRVDILVSGISQQILSMQKMECDKQVQREVDNDQAKEVQVLWSKFVHQVKHMSSQLSTSRTIIYLDHFEVRKPSFSRSLFGQAGRVLYAPTDEYYVSGRQEYLREDEIEYHIHLLRLRADESQKVQLELDPSYVPTPILEERLTHSFRVSSSTVIKYAHLLERGRILLGLVDPHGDVVIYVESLSRINAAIQRRSFARFFHRDKIGETCLFAFDESKRMLAVYSSARMQLHIFTIEDERGSLRGMGSAIDLLPFYGNGVSIVHACFVHGREEILPASLQLPHVPRAIYSSPDGSCALVVQEKDGVSNVTAYHWTTFASTDGISITLPDFPVDLDAALLTSITSTSHDKETVHNSLIDCHSEVWTRFPVVAAVKRHTITSSSDRQQRTLTFVTDDDQRPFSSYFSELIRSFTKTSRKPTGNVLKGTTVFVRTFPSFANQFLSSPKWPVSSFRAGEWLADLLCLIPIQIAITYENRFVPLKDGVLSTELEKSLLGAEVNRIVDSLSVGWYESIFQSYWASKPIKVVSSMGEQSVGKSFTLNHLLDTSFAGSAMRTTEGVWLSVSPTDDALIVALDFEEIIGVHSLERSAQEDTLLVLFNTALSNLVLFRNNFALSRDISGLFQSFQSSTSILDPASNPSLFQSKLLVIIKAGKLNIIPWPVIESEEFYRLFRNVKKTLDKQPTSHHTAGEFLLTLKTLMAKLKANDWGAMSQTVANHRADSLLAILPNALETGFSEIDPSPVPLKNFDTDVVIGGEDSEARFVITEPNSPDHEYPLTTLRDSWDLTTQRQYLNDSMWHSNLVQYLTHLVDLRVAHVKNWLESNVQRFEEGHASIEELRRIFDGVSTVVPSANATISQQSPVVKPRAIQEIIFAELGLIYAESLASSQDHGLVAHILMSDLASQSNTTVVTSAQPRSICVARKTEHTDHQCEDRECPASCQLCNRMCSGGHLHGLKSGQNHLCGKEHPCTALCSAGICEVQTKPHAIEATFVGTHETFQYTRYTQVAKHLPCSKVIEPGEVEHPGLHIHSNDNKPFHYCDSRCLLALDSFSKSNTSAGHSPKQAHVTRHGSMSKTRWVVDDPDGTGLEIEGRNFSSNDDGAPMLCNLVSKVTRDHGSIGYCFTRYLSADPYSQEDRANFAKCFFVVRIFVALIMIYEGPEHTTEVGGANAQPSSCTQPMFHTPLNSSPGPGYISNDGHHFACKNPALLQPAFHVIFVIDKSGSMSWADQSPLPNAPGSHLIRSRANNRLGAVFSSLYSFWIARQATLDRNGQSSGGFRRDAYSLILFDSAPTTCFENDLTSSPDELLNKVLKYEAGGNTDFTCALKRAQAVMTSHWSNERTPVVIFLSDGWCEISDECIYDICRTASSRRMVEIAQEVQKTVPQNVLTVNIPSSFTKALDTVSLTTAFQGFAESLAKPRGNLLSSRFVGNNVGSGRLVEN